MIKTQWPAKALLVTLTLAPAPVEAADPNFASAFAMELSKATFWDQHGKPEVALAFYSRVLQFQPNNIEALAGAARLALDKADTVVAAQYLNRLRKLSPDDGHIASLVAIGDRTPSQIDALNEARKFAAAGKQDEAIARYRRLFAKDGAVPEDIAAEFYPLLIATLPPNSVEANNALIALSKLAAEASGNDELQFVLAQSMVALESSRPEGIKKLQSLTRLTSVGLRAHAVWREVMLWQGPDAQSQTQLEDYLSENPTDPTIEAKREEFRLALGSESQARIRMRGYEAIRAKQFGLAEKQFQTALQQNTDDVDSLIMMAAIRQQQGKRADSKQYLEHALALAPDRHDELLGIVGADPAANALAAQAGARAGAAPYQDVARLTSNGNYGQAEQNLLRLIGTNPKVGMLLQLADIQTRSGKLDAAADSLRRVKDLDPNNTDASLALSAILTRQGKPDAAAAALMQAEAIFTRTGNAKGLQNLRSARSEILRNEARSQRDPLAQQATLGAALAIDPTNAWLRLDLAKNLQKSNFSAEAEATMAPLSSSGANLPDTLQVGFLWLWSRGDLVHAAKWAASVSPAARTPLMQTVIAQVDAKADIVAATRSGDAKDSREQLLALAITPDPTGERAAEIGRALLHLGDPRAMSRVLATGLSQTPVPTNVQRIVYARVLLQGHRPVEARRMIAGIEPARVPVDLRASLTGLIDDIAAAQADASVKENRFADAWDNLAPRLSESPDNVNLNLSLSRLQVASGDPKGALTVSVMVMEHNPTDLSARLSAIEAAQASGNRRVVERLVVEGRTLFPEDPFLLMRASLIARAHGDNGTALEDMLKARAMRVRQLALEQ